MEKYKTSRNAYGNIGSVLSMENDFCVKCGSENLKIKEKELEFKIPNPGIVTVRQECEECQSCGEVYFDSEQISELSQKIKRKIPNKN